MEVECDAAADAEIFETLDEVELDDTCAGASNHEESLAVLTTGGTGRVAAVGCGSCESALGDGVTESGVSNVGRGRRSVGTMSQKDVNDSIQVAAAETPGGEATVGKMAINLELLLRALTSKMCSYIGVSQSNKCKRVLLAVWPMLMVVNKVLL